MKTILIVEDDLAISQFYKLVLSKAGYEVVQAFSCMETIDQFLAVSPDVMLLDLALPDGDGLSVLPSLNIGAEYIKNLIIVISANADALERVNDAGIKHFFQKPVSIKTLIKAIEDSLA